MLHNYNNQWRLLLLCGCVLVSATAVISRLVELHFGGEATQNLYTGEVSVRQEHIPAQRGIIMDRREEILTNNIQNCELIGDRYHLRDIDRVIEALSYNQAIYDPEWLGATEKDREKLISTYEQRLNKQVKRKLTEEEKEERRRQAALNTKMKTEIYKPDMRDLYFDLHDQLVSEILYPYIGHMSVIVNDATTHKRIKRAIKKEDIIEMIAQRATEAYNAKARAEGRPTRTVKKRIVIAKALSQDHANKLRQALKISRIAGVSIEINPERSYAEPEHLAHVVGFVNAENHGVNGIEARFEHYLSGSPGVREYRANNRGQIIPNADDRYLSARPGLNVQLTIDMRIQSIVEEELDRALRDYKSPRGCIIVMNPKTGDILAMASRPSFDLNSKDLITATGRSPRNNTLGVNGAALTGEMNYATQTRYEPGSTFKVIAMAAALDQNKISLETPIDTSPIHVPGGKPVSDGKHRYGVLPAWAVMKKSSNPGTLVIARTVGWKVFKNYMDAFGVTKAIPLEIPNGGACRMADPSVPINFSRICFGYSIDLSPLHMAIVYSTIANDGLRPTPRLVNKIIDSNGRVFDECKPPEPVAVIKPSTARKLREALCSVTVLKDKHGRGTAVLAGIPGFKVAGKTGTAKKVKEGGRGYHENLYTVSFAGMIPADKPELVIMTVIDEPQYANGMGIGGGTVAAPIFRTVTERLIDLLNLEPDDPIAFREYRDNLRKTASTPSNSSPTSSDHE